MPTWQDILDESAATLAKWKKRAALCENQQAIKNQATDADIYHNQQQLRKKISRLKYYDWDDFGSFDISEYITTLEFQKYFAEGIYSPTLTALSPDKRLAVFRKATNFITPPYWRDDCIFLDGKLHWRKAGCVESYDAATEALMAEANQIYADMQEGFYDS